MLRKKINKPRTSAPGRGKKPIRIKVAVKNTANPAPRPALREGSGPSEGRGKRTPAKKTRAVKLDAPKKKVRKTPRRAAAQQKRKVNIGELFGLIAMLLIPTFGIGLVLSWSMASLFSATLIVAGVVSFFYVLISKLKNKSYKSYKSLQTSPLTPPPKQERGTNSRD